MNSNDTSSIQNLKTSSARESNNGGRQNPYDHYRTGMSLCESSHNGQILTRHLILGLAIALAVSSRHLVAVFGLDSMSMYVGFVVHKVEIGEVFCQT